MIVRNCDRCGEPIRNNENYWHIFFQEIPNSQGMNSTAGVSENMKNHHKILTETQEDYCAECVNEIKAIIRKKM